MRPYNSLKKTEILGPMVIYVAALKCSEFAASIPLKKEVDTFVYGREGVWGNIKFI